MQKAKIFYFTVFVLVVFAFIFHVTAMGHHHWKIITSKNTTNTLKTTIGLFKRCEADESKHGDFCFLNKFPCNDGGCSNWEQCINPEASNSCQCEFLPSTKGIASCTIIASIFLGISIVIMFIHSIDTTDNRVIGLCFSFFPLLLLLLAFIFILIAMILVGSYLSRDAMYMTRTSPDDSIADLRQKAANMYNVKIGWSAGLEIIALVLTFFSMILYSIFVFKIGRTV